jgi:hypothetical protein
MTLERHDPAALVGTDGGDCQVAGVAGEDGPRGEALDTIGRQIDDHLAAQAVGPGHAAYFEQGCDGGRFRRLLQVRRNLRTRSW